MRLWVLSWSFRIRTMHCPPPLEFYHKLVQMSIFPSQKFIYGRIIVNISLNHGDVKKRCLNKSVSILLELPNKNNSLPYPTGIFHKLVQMSIFPAKNSYMAALLSIFLYTMEMCRNAASIRFWYHLEAS